LLAITIGASMLAGVLLPIVVRVERMTITALDVELAVAVVVMSGAVWILWRRGVVVAALGLALVWAGIFPILLGMWFPRLQSSSVRIIAAVVRERFGEGAFVFYGDDRSLPLCFALRQEIRTVRKGGELMNMARA